MKIKDIKAPSDLKERTLILMEKERKTEGGQRHISKNLRLIAVPAASAAAVCCGLFALLSFPAETASDKAAAESAQTEISMGEGYMERLAEGSSENAAMGLLEQITGNPEPSAKTENLIPYIQKPHEDNTDPDAVAIIKAGFCVQWPLTDYHISCAYNDYQEDGVPLHPEVDMAATEGTEIYPLCEGTVIETGYDASRGNYIIIDHGNGLLSSYGHCKEMLVSKNDTVTSASAIATVGKSGMATGPFLAFSVTLNGTPVNPEALFE